MVSNAENLGLFISRLAHSFYIQTQQMQVTICAVELNDHVTWAQNFVSKWNRNNYDNDFFYKYQSEWSTFNLKSYSESINQTNVTISKPKTEFEEKL